MFGVGWTEMLVIGVVALVVIGPKDLPVVMNRLGKAIAAIRRMGSEFQREINKTTGLDQITDLRRSLTEPLKKTAAEITKEFNRTTSDGAVVPSGAIKPADPKAESVVDEIHAATGITPPLKTAALESPAPAEAIAPATKPARKPRAAAGDTTAAPPRPRTRKPSVAATDPATGVMPDFVTKPAAAPRKKRAPPPKPEA